MIKHIKTILVSLLLIPLVFFAAGCSLFATSLKDASISIEVDSYHYTGHAITPEVTVKLKNKDLTLNKDYIISYSDNTELGEATITVTGKNGYKDSKSINFLIVEGQIEHVSAQDITTSYGTSSIGTNIFVEGTRDGDIISYRTSQEDEWSLENPTFLEVGEHLLYYKVERDNHTPFISSAKINILKGDFLYDNFEFSAVYTGAPISLGLEQQLILPEGTTVAYSDFETGIYYDYEPTNIIEVGVYDIYVKFTHPSYHQSIVKLTFTVEKGYHPQDLTLEREVFAYSPQGHTINISNLKQGSVVSYKLSAEVDYSEVNPTLYELGAYQIFVKIQSPNYKDYYTSFLVNIIKATPQIDSIPTPDTIYHGQRLQESLLQDGQASVSGQFIWQNQAITPSVTDSLVTEYDVVFLPDDTQRYEQVLLKVKIKVLKATPTIEGEPRLSNIFTYGNSLGDVEVLGNTSVLGQFVWETPDFKPQVSDSNSTLFKVTFVPEDLVNYNTVSLEILIEVNKANIDNLIIVSDNEVEYNGEAHSIILTSEVENFTITYKVDIEENFTSETPTFVEPGTYKIYYKIEKENYHNKEGFATLTITKATPEILTPPTPTNLVSYDYLSNSELIGGQASVAGTFEWASDYTVTYENNQEGHLIVFIPQDELKYNRVNIYVDILLQKATPTVTINSLDYIVIEGMLAQDIDFINYSATVAGQIEFHAGQNLEFGKNNLAWTFLPTDSFNFSIVTGILEVDAYKINEISIDGETYLDYYAFDTIIPELITINVSYINSEDEIIDFLYNSNDFTVEYPNQKGYLSVEMPYVTLYFAGGMIQYDVIVYPIEANLHDFVLEYVGPKYSEGYVLLTSYFKVESEYCGYLEILDGSDVNPDYFSTINYRFHFNEPANFTESYVEGYFNFEIGRELVTKNLKINTTELIIESAYTYHELDVENSLIEILIEYDDEMGYAILYFDNQDIELASNTLFTIDIGNNHDIYIRIFSIDSQELIEEHSIYIYSEKYIENIYATIFTGYEYYQQTLGRETFNSLEVSGYYLYVSDLLIDIVVETKEGFTYLLTYQGQPFELQNLSLGYHDIELEIYQNGEFIETKTIHLVYHFRAFGLYAIDADNSVLDAQEFTQDEQINHYIMGMFGDNPLQLYSHSDNISFQLYTVSGELITEAPVLQEGFNYFKVKVIYNLESTDTYQTFFINLNVINVKNNPDDYVESIRFTEWDSNDNFIEIDFINIGYYTNLYHSLTPEFNLEKVKDGLEIQLKDFEDADLTQVETQVIDNTYILVTLKLHDEELVSVKIYVIWSGDYDNDTTVLYNLQTLEGYLSGKVLDPDNPQITVRVGYMLELYSQNDYAQFDVQSEVLPIRQGNRYVEVYLNRVGTFTLDFVITSVDGTAFEEFTLTLIILPEPELLNIKFKNDNELSLKLNMMDMSFGDFSMIGYEDEEYIIYLEKTLDIDNLDLYLEDDKLNLQLLNLFEDNMLLVNGVQVENAVNLQLELIKDEEIYYIQLHYILVQDDMNVILDLKIIFKKFYPLLTLTSIICDSEGIEITTIKNLFFDGDVISGDIYRLPIEDENIYMLNMSELVPLLDNYAQLNIELFQDFTVIDFFTGELVDLNQSSFETSPSPLTGQPSIVLTLYDISLGDFEQLTSEEIENLVMHIIVIHF